jgi:hypothetical protein
MAVEMPTPGFDEIIQFLEDVTLLREAHSLLTTKALPMLKLYARTRVGTFTSAQLVSLVEGCVKASHALLKLHSL